MNKEEKIEKKSFWPGRDSVKPKVQEINFGRKIERDRK